MKIRMLSLRWSTLCFALFMTSPVGARDASKMLGTWEGHCEGYTLGKLSSVDIRLNFTENTGEYITGIMQTRKEGASDYDAPVSYNGILKNNKFQGVNQQATQSGQLISRNKLEFSCSTPNPSHYRRCVVERLKN